MSVTIYLTDHHGKKIAFFYRIDNERYSLTPQLLWCCRNYPEYQGVAESKESFIEQCKDVMRELKKRSVPVCKDCGLTIHGKDFESHDKCPDCLIND